jgi:AraC-like DNA-binding protein
MSVLGVRAIAAALVARGVDAAAALVRVGIEPAQLADPERRIELTHAFALFDLACELTGDPHFGLHAAALVPGGSLDVLEYAIRSCATIGDAIAQLARYYAVINDRAALAIVRTPTRYAVVYRSPQQLATPRPAKEFLFAYMLSRGAAFCGRPIPLVEVRFAHPPPPGAELQAAFFAAPVHYAAGADSLELSPEVADAPQKERDPGLSNVLGRLLDQRLTELGSRDLLGDVKTCIGGMLPHGAPSLEQTARAMATSGRTLQRRLRESGTRFSELIATVQRELSVRYLRDSQLGVAEVAYLVGFADTTSFHRAFRRWTGQTPAAARRGAPS